MRERPRHFGRILNCPALLPNKNGSAKIEHGQNHSRPSKPLPAACVKNFSDAVMNTQKTMGISGKITPART